jgi:O-6-methylguanine DNA methyltransferase
MTQSSTAFTERVLKVIERIPAGRVATYGDIAALAGNPRAARAVGTIMRTAPRQGLPCHRVVGSGGMLGGYGGRTTMKAGLLRAEGVVIRGTRITNFRACRWNARPARSTSAG